ncbi:MAG: exosortase/archaeosortase family protein [Anaerolineae bacterium]|nr:exosortase/archaeosortase family protein [Phycisphaerae bacterium]
MSTASPPSNLDYRSDGHSADGQMLRPREVTYFGLPLSAWVQIAAIATAMAVLFWPNLRRLILKTNPFTGEANWGHSIVIPIIGIYYLYVNRDELLRATVKPAWTGLFVMLAGILIAGYGIYPGRNDTVWDYGMVITLIGVVLLTCGWQVMKVAWFPLLFLFAAIPFPGLIYSKMAMPLQNIAAKVAVVTLQLTGVDATVSGTKIHMGNGIMSPVRTLNVAEACAGLRSLMTFISVAAAVAFLSSRPLWQKLVITVSAIPIAISCNVMRVAGQGLLDHYWSPEVSEGFAHQFVGLAMMVPAFFLVLMVGWLLDKIFVEEVAEQTDQPKKTARVPKRVGQGYRSVAAVAATGSASAPANSSEAPRRQLQEGV